MLFCLTLKFLRNYRILHSVSNALEIRYRTMNDDQPPASDSSDSSDITQRIVRGTRDAIMLTDLNGKILFVNPAFCRLYGFREDEVLGKTPGILRSNRHDSAFYARMWHALERGMVWDGNVYNQRKDGTILLVEETISTLHEPDGKASHYLAVMREQIMQGWRSSKGHKTTQTRDTMVAGLAHDFNNLVSPLLGYADMATIRARNGEVPINEIQQICLAATRARELAQQVLTFCRHETVELEVVFLEGIIKDVVSLLAVECAENVGIATNIEKDCGTIFGEPIQMHQVLMNLCNNAMRSFGPEGGVLDISLQPLVIDNNSPYVGDLDMGRYVKLSISDTGCGMDEETLRQAFDPFYSSRHNAEGIGLGLTIVQKIVQEHDGQIYVRSEPEIGTTFDVILPRRESHHLSDTQRIPMEDMPVGQGTILLVDDEQAIVQMGKNMLEYVGYNVVGLTGSEQALERFSTRPYDFDLIIADQVMPGVKGIDLARKARDIRAEIPIVIITGFAHKVPQGEVEGLGNCACLQKPFSSQELLSTVQKLLHKQQGSEQD